MNEAAYRLARKAGGRLLSARKADVSPQAPRVTATVQSIAASWLVIVVSDDALATLLIDAASVSLAEHVVGNRTGHPEPRTIKRHPKPHYLLTKPRA